MNYIKFKRWNSNLGGYVIDFGKILSSSHLSEKATKMHPCTHIYCVELHRAIENDKNWTISFPINSFGEGWIYKNPETIILVKDLVHLSEEEYNVSIVLES